MLPAASHVLLQAAQHGRASLVVVVSGCSVIEWWFGSSADTLLSRLHLYAQQLSPSYMKHSPIALLLVPVSNLSAPQALES